MEEEENQGGAPQTDEFGRPINNSGELDTFGQQKGMNKLPTSPPQQENEDHYARMYRKYARQQPKAPDYRNEKAERFGRLLGDTFKMVADSIGVGINAHTVAPLDSDKHYKDIADREEQKRLKYEQELEKTDDANRNLALQLEKMRRDDEFAKEKAEAAAAQFRMNYGLDQQKLDQTNEHNKKVREEQVRHNKKTEGINAARARANGAAQKSGKPYYNHTANFGDGKGYQNIPLSEGQVNYLFDGIMKKYGYDSSKNFDIKLLQQAIGSGGASKDLVKQMLAKYPEIVNPLLLEMMPELAQQSKEEESQSWENTPFNPFQYNVPGSSKAPQPGLGAAQGERGNLNFNY